MTRKDYNLIANTLKNNYADEHLCRAFARELANNNPNFDIDKFLDACGIDW